MPKTKPSFAEIALEMYESVEHAKNKERKLLSTTFWHEFRVKKKTTQVIERVARILKEQGLSVSVKSGAILGKEKHNDWILLNKWPPDFVEPVIDNIPMPSPDWFDRMKDRKFEGEREVEYFFILPILEQLGYDENDIAIGYSINLYTGGHKTKTEADIIAFNGPNREKDNALLLIEAKKAKKNVNGINSDQIGQARAYALSLFPPYYIITNGQKIIVFRFNGGRYQDAKVMDFERSVLAEKWDEFYRHVSKKATMQRLENIKTTYVGDETPEIT